MNSEIGILAGGTAFELGTRIFVRGFFLAIKEYVFREQLYRQLDWTLITDDFYMRTVKNEQLDALTGQVSQLLLAMQEVSFDSVDWTKLGFETPPNVKEKFQRLTLADAFKNFEVALAHCTLSTKIGLLNGWNYPLLRIGDIQNSIFEKRRPPEHYEALGPNDLPFWLRDDIEYPEITRIVMDGSRD